jgi:hypothetical protein
MLPRASGEDGPRWIADSRVLSCDNVAPSPMWSGVDGAFSRGVLQRDGNRVELFDAERALRCVITHSRSGVESASMCVNW